MTLFRDKSAFIEELRIQQRLLKKAVDEFDKGGIDEVRNITRALRILCLQDQHGNPSLIEMAGEHTRHFFDTSIRTHRHNIIPELSLTVAVIGPISLGPKAPLDTVMERRKMTFKEWKEQTIIDDRCGVVFDRNRLIKTVSNTDGGTHYPPDVRPFFKRLKEMAFTAQRDNDSVEISMKGLENHSIRQIAHEIIISFDPNYKRPICVENGTLILCAMEAFIYPGRRMTFGMQTRTMLDGYAIQGQPHGFTSISGPRIELPHHKTGKNDPCPCYSGLKFKNCCSESREFDEEFIKKFKKDRGFE